MSKPTTLSGRGVAAFLRGLLPETDQFDKQIAEAEREAAEAAIERVRLEIRAACGRRDFMGGPPVLGQIFDILDAATKS